MFIEIITLPVDELVEEIHEKEIYSLKNLIESVNIPRFQAYLADALLYEIDEKQFLHEKRSLRKKKKIKRAVYTGYLKYHSNDGYIAMQVLEKQETDNPPDIPQVIDDTEIKSDGFSISGFTTLPNLNFTEYLRGNSNQAYTDCLINSARTISIKYAAIKYANNPQKLEEIIHKYKFEKKLEDLPFPKMGNSVRVHAQIIPVPNLFYDKKFIEENIPFDIEKWVLEIIYGICVVH